VEGGRKAPLEPAAQGSGTRVEVRDLFFATPARLKFLKTPRSELGHAKDALARLAMAHPEVGFTLASETRRLLDLPPAGGELFESRLKRLSAVMGRDFAENALPIEAVREDLRLTGFIGLPTLNRANAQSQYLFVNGRPVRDKLLFGAVRGAYRDFLAHDRHPLVALFLELPPELVDVNVHPAKTEVRFREPAMVRGLIVGACRHALSEAGHRASTTVSAAALGRFEPGSGQPGVRQPGSWRSGSWPSGSWQSPATAPRGFAEAAAAYHAPLPGVNGAPAARPGAAEDPEANGAETAYPLGAARAQVHETYIVAQTEDGIVIVDQHAAHERLVYERMKLDLAAEGVAAQLLLIPEVVELDERAAERLAARAPELKDLGLVLEPFGPGSVVVREVPALLGEADVQGLVRDLADQLAAPWPATARCAPDAGSPARR
jgi:DNA mismatch repair protein MutL